MKLKHIGFLNTKQRRQIRKLFVDFSYPVFRYDLNTLAKFCGTDKFGFHDYTPLYSNHFKLLRNKKIKLLEIGVGGYKNPDYGGNSLRMWKKYFKKGEIYGIDIFDKSSLEEKRVKIFKGDQSDKLFLSKVIKEVGNPDIIIDDGSHKNDDVINSFKYLFPKLKKGGLYVIEDTQTSYLNEYGGDNKNIKASFTTMNFFKNLVDHVNEKELRKKLTSNFEPLIKIKEIHFYNKIIFLVKS
tara:strand:+ start:428 stop:1147 length:720 start_codon:yes stop_codon:yes gene_type:complete